jgi:hypothetical protein
MSNDKNLLSELIALSHSPIHNHLKEEDVKALRLEDEQTAEEFIYSDGEATEVEVPLWNHDSRMAFHILYDATDVEIITRVRRPYPGKPVLYQKDEHFMQHETRQVLDALMPEGARYGIVTFEASGKDGCKDMAETAKFLCRHGWTEGDERFRVVYADVNGTGTMVLVSASANVKRLKDLGVFISSDPKAPKRMRRTMAAHQSMLEAQIVSSYPVPTGQVTMAKLKSHLHSQLQHEAAQRSGDQLSGRLWRHQPARL